MLLIFLQKNPYSHPVTQDFFVKWDLTLLYVSLKINNLTIAIAKMKM